MQSATSLLSVVCHWVVNQSPYLVRRIILCLHRPSPIWVTKCFFGRPETPSKAKASNYRGRFSNSGPTISLENLRRGRLSRLGSVDAVVEFVNVKVYRHSVSVASFVAGTNEPTVETPTSSAAGSAASSRITVKISSPLSPNSMAKTSWQKIQHQNHIQLEENNPD